MRQRSFPALLLALMLAAIPALGPMAIATAQESAAEMPPMPRPRPNPDAPAPTAAPVPATPTPATEAVNALASTPQPVTLNARITSEGAFIPDGLVWRIFDTRPDANGELALVAKSDLAAPRLELSPGDYVVHLAYGRAQVSEPLGVSAGTNEKTFILDAGALRLNSAITGDIPIPGGLLKFDIYTAGEENDRALVAQGVLPNEIVTLNTGIYHIVSHFGSVNALVRADLRVESGQLTDATLYHHASEISFKLVSEAGGEAIADVEWTVKTADGTTVFSDLGAFPSTVLAQGDYLVFAKLGTQVYNRDFQVQPGAAREVEVLTAVY
ncbi:hypothetical protein [Devosia sp.]|uniref:hypothetical protein n=1 Tax=Devosia sp. TaxID=1871048 RepID=UPI002AFE6305|nr:hypothetical protein [Devosia sp.]